ncbi:MAG: hypothetical protein HWQ38_23985 [Nostoc sp. NMS7]|uniref:hypothetical protein n=1 Tax=Nostoc sp. NMS7 TaxID=2815391 RepID=UPI0025E5DB59|nr:hypothetical protein [Nostoc sp. NMS7]MBN3949353.1 hypothetical protein [Nostoc sp. NMS7]
MSPSLEDFFRNHKDKTVDFALRVNHSEDGSISFYIHPQNVDGETWDFKVIGNSLFLIPPVPQRSDAN